MPGRKWYVISLGVLVAGTIATAFFIWTRITWLDTRLVRFVVPGSVELAAEEPGTYTVFHEPRSIVDGRYYESEDIAGLLVRADSVASGQPITLTKPSLKETYSLGGYSGEAVLTFEVPTPQRIRLSARYDDGRSEPKLVLTVAQGIIGSLFATVFEGIAMGFASIGSALTIACVTYVKRRRAHERVQAAPPATT